MKHSALHVEKLYSIKSCLYFINIEGKSEDKVCIKAKIKILSPSPSQSI